MVVDTEMVDVIFRKDREGVVYALMPGLAGTNNPHTCTSYEHNGQHSSAALSGCINASKPASDEESRGLLKELQQVGYLVNVIRHATRRHFEQRVSQL